MESRSELIDVPGLRCDIIAILLWCTCQREVGGSSQDFANLHPRALPIIETFCRPVSLIRMQGLAQVRVSQGRKGPFGKLKAGSSALAPQKSRVSQDDAVKRVMLNTGDYCCREMLV